MATTLSIHAANAVSSLSDAQLTFINSLPKAELHAHLNGCIPLEVLRDLAKDYSAEQDSMIESSIKQIQDGIELNELHDFFNIFPAIYALTSTPVALARATRAVLHDFLHPDHPQVAYIELRSTPRQTPSMTRLQYVQTVLDEIEVYSSDQAALIVSLDRRMDDATAAECVDIAVQLRKAGRRVLGVDLCGDPTVESTKSFGASNLHCFFLATFRQAIWNSLHDTLRRLEVLDWG
jgi:adenosine deaminase